MTEARRLSQIQEDVEGVVEGQEGKDQERKRRRNARLDNRVVQESLTVDEKKLADKNVIRRMAINCGLILLWYIFSLGISLVSPAPCRGETCGASQGTGD